MALKLPWRTCWWSIHSVLCRVAGNHQIIDSGATDGWVLIIGRLAQPTPVSNTTVISHPLLVVLQFVHWPFDCQWTHFDNQASEESLQQAFSAIWWSVSGLSKFCWNMYFLNYLCYTWSHSWHLVDSSIELFSKSLTCPNVFSFFLAKLLTALMGFERLRAAFYTKTTHERTQSQLNDVCHGWHMVSDCRPLDSGGTNGWL